MKQEDYAKLVVQYHGQCYGKTSQGNFIDHINAQHVGAVKYFIQSISQTLLNRKIFNIHEILNTQGICNGLVQALFISLKSSQDLEAGLKNFAKLLDTYDINLANKAASLQALSYEDYKLISCDFHLKSLGVDMDENKKFEPYSNKAIEAILKRAENFTPIKEGGKSSKEKSINSERLAKRRFDQGFDDLCQYVCEQPSHVELFKIVIEPKKDITDLLETCIPSHAILVFKQLDKNGYTNYVFYDPNQLPTVFKDKNDFKAFLVKYLDIAANELNKLLHSDSASFSILKYTINKAFHHTMHELMNKIDKKITQNSNYINPDLLNQLKILNKQCDYADRYSMMYNEPSNPSSIGNDHADEIIQRYFAKIHNASSFASTQVLLSHIDAQIDKIKKYDMELAEELKEVIHASPSPKP